MREQPPKNGVARQLWDMTDEEIDAVFGADEEAEDV